MGWIWVVAGLILVGIELMAPAYLFFLSFGVAAIAAGAFEILGIISGWEASAAVFVASSAASLASLWKLGAKLREKNFVPSNVDSLIGKEGAVLGVLGKPEAPFGYLVRVELEQWSARPADSKITLSPGDAVRVKKVEGVFLIVEKVNGG